MNRSHRLVPWAATLLLAVASAGADEPAGRGAVADDVVGRIDRYLQDVEAFGFSGTVLVEKGGSVLLLEGYGLSDRAKETRNGSDTLFEIASASKQVTAAAVLSLEAEGKIALDDPISKYLEGVPEKHGKVTVNHLLTHTSGFPRMGPSGGGTDLAAAVAAYLRGERGAEPGTRFEYWNGGYALLAAIVERVSGMPFPEFCRKRLFEPAAMSRTGFCGDAHLSDLSDVAHGYVDDKDMGRADSHSFGWEYRGMGGIVTSARDLLAWDRALRGDRILSPASRAKLYAPRLHDYACGWFVTATKDHGRIASHGGTVAGFETQIIRYLDEDVVVTVLANTQGVGWQVGYHVAGLLMGEGFPLGKDARAPAPAATIRLPAADLERLAGRYALTGGGTFVVRAAGPGLIVGAEGQAAVDLLARPGEAPDPERFGPERRLAQEMIEGLARGEVIAIKDRLVPHIPKMWPEILKTFIWPKHVGQWGGLRSVEDLGGREERGGSGVRLWFRLRHEKGDPTAEVVLQERRLSIFDLHGRAFAVVGRYLPAERGVFVAYDFGRPVPPPLAFDVSPEGTARFLEVRDPSGGSSARASRLATEPR